MRTKDLQIERFNLSRKSKEKDKTYNFEDGFMEISQFDVDRFGFEVVGITDEGSFQLINSDSKAVVIDVLKRDDEMFYSFGISIDENYLAFEGILIEDAVINKKVLYVYQMNIDGELEEKCRFEYESKCEDYDFMSNINIIPFRDNRDEYLITGVSMRTRTFYSFLLRKNNIEKFKEEIELKKEGIIKCAKYYHNGMFCVGGDDCVTYVEVSQEEDTEGDERLKKKVSGVSSKLNVGIRRKMRKGFL